jgi:hypothetical protein
MDIPEEYTSLSSQPSGVSGDSGVSGGDEEIEEVI